MHPRTPTFKPHCFPPSFNNSRYSNARLVPNLKFDECRGQLPSPEELHALAVDTLRLRLHRWIDIEARVLLVLTQGLR